MVRLGIKMSKRQVIQAFENLGKALPPDVPFVDELPHWAAVGTSVDADLLAVVMRYVRRREGVQRCETLRQNRGIQPSEGYALACMRAAARSGDSSFLYTAFNDMLPQTVDTKTNKHYFVLAAACHYMSDIRAMIEALGQMNQL
eukprot:Hpha_TRINITY_DN19212_c0_g1::TRINITY_DN19212_c0_g1_i1::g.194273::m.194273